MSSLALHVVECKLYCVFESHSLRHYLCNLALTSWCAATFAREKKGKLDSRELYELAMEKFKHLLLVDDQNQTAIKARSLFEKDGFHFLRDEQKKLKPTLPMLNDPHVESRIDLTRHADLLRISGQHLKKIKDNGDALDPNNLSFMIARDNVQMDVSGPLSEYVRQKVVEYMRARRARSS